jgi:hypothetical protein
LAADLFPPADVLAIPEFGSALRASFGDPFSESPMFRFACLALSISLAAGTARAAAVSIQPEQFDPSATTITFETGSTGLPSVPGATFVNEAGFSGESNFEGFFGDQGWSNLVSITYFDLGLRFDPAVQAVGAWMGRVPNFTNDHPPSVTFEIFDVNLQSLGVQSVAIPAAFDSPVWFGFASDVPIARAEWRVNDTGFIGLDNVMFGPIVPEPSTAGLALAAAASLAVGSRLRRMRRI